MMIDALMFSLSDLIKFVLMSGFVSLVIILFLVLVVLFVKMIYGEIKDMMK